MYFYNVLAFREMIVSTYVCNVSLQKGADVSPKSDTTFYVRMKAAHKSQMYSQGDPMFNVKNAPSFCQM
jgi:hypothetical protein